MATLQLTDSQQARLQLQAVDKKGAAVDVGQLSPTWASSDETVVTVVASVDGGTANVVAQKPGTAQVSVSATVDGQPLAGTLDITVVPGAAASLTISTGAPSEQ